MENITENLVVSFRVEIEHSSPAGRAAAIKCLLAKVPEIASIGASPETGRYKVTSVTGGQPAVQDADCFISTLRLSCIVANLHRQLRASRRASPLWSLVSDLFGTGSTSSAKICKAAKYNPDQPCSNRQLEHA